MIANLSRFAKWTAYLFLEHWHVDRVTEASCPAKGGIVTKPAASYTSSAETHQYREKLGYNRRFEQTNTMRKYILVKLDCLATVLRKQSFWMGFLEKAGSSSPAAPPRSGASRR